MKNLLVLLLCAALTTTNAQIVLSLEEVASGFTKPLEIVHAGDERLFVAEQPGRIRVLWPDGTVAPQPFLDITDRVLDNANERGLLGLAFHPQYATNGWFFVNYTGSGGKTVVSRFSVSADPDLADPDSELVLLEI
ncbi:MAG: cadherin, partial [Bacteroidetes bacterium]